MYRGNGWKKRLVSTLLTVAMLVVMLPATLVSSAEHDYDLPWLWPVPGSYKINSLDYYYSGGLHNAGQCIDIGSNGYSGANRLDVVSATTGTVLYIQNKYDEATNKGAGWGNYVIVRSGNVNIVYGHLQTVTCSYGTIKAGDVIGKMGNTGNSTGVHLHLQAYPVGENASSAAIRVFEQYRTNPLYYEKFQFMKGLKTESVAYGDWISSYYTKLSGSYYAYSGGLSLDYTIIPASAVVTVINTSGATVRSEPLKENAYNVDTLKYGSTVDIIGHYTDGYGTSWLLVSETDGMRSWIMADDVGFRDYHFGTELINAVSPEGTFGAFWDLTFAGTLVSDNVVDSFTANLMKDGETVASYTKNVGLTTYSFTDTIKEGLGIQELADGTYTYVLSVSERATYPGADPVIKEATLTTSTFTIDSNLSDRVPPLLEAIHVTSLTPAALDLRCIATDNKHMDKVVVVLASEDGSFTKTFETEADGDSYLVTISAAELNGAGNYVITATAYDSYGNTDIKMRTVVIPASGLSETWVVQDVLKVRGGPGTSYEHLRTLKAGAKITISDVESCGTYMWGNIGNGWCAIDFCSYESGYLYQIAFDLNGGTGTVPVPIHKRYGVNAVIPAEVPTREGYTFLGWARSSDAKTPDYLADASYVDNASVTLFAIWSDTTYPSLVSVTKDPTGWTNGNVTLTVHGADNTGVVYYSFDGGKSWTADGKLVVKENTEFPSRTFAIKDPSGNVTYYNEAFVVDNIDKLAPNMEGAKIGVTVGKGEATFTAVGIVDEQSGLSTYELILSATRDFAEFVTVPMVPGTPVALEDGVYYGKLKVTDGAGNASVTEFARFRVGEASPLSIPVGLTVVKTTSETVEMKWNATENADSYVLFFSRTPDFSDDVIEYAASGTMAIVTGLEAGVTYFGRILATTADGVFLDSEPSPAIRFVTLNDDNTLHGFLSMEDAVIRHDDNTVAWTAPYAAVSLDLSAIVDDTAAVSYWYDEAMTGEISDLAVRTFPFIGNTANAYIFVTAENGESRLYTVSVTRSAEAAAMPTVDFEAAPQTLFVGEIPSPLSVIASVSDGGTLSVTWYISHNGGEFVPMGTGVEWQPVCEKAGNYSIYAVVTNTNPKCQTTAATYTTDTVDITVNKLATSISVLTSDYTYNGSTPTLAISGYTGNGAVTYRFFTDAEGNQEIEPPINSGVYYVIAYAAETDTHLGASSKAVRFEILKQVNENAPTLTVVQPTLRDRNGYVTISEDGVEYRIAGTEAWLAAEKGMMTFAEPVELEFRLKETQNVAAGTVASVSILAFDGTDDFIPNESMGLTVEDGYLLVNGSGLMAELLLAGLEKTEGINLYAPDGTKLNGTDTIVGTGAQIAIEDEEGIYKSLVVIVLGDLDGDGIVTRADAMKILELSNGMAISESPYDLPAGDMNHDGILTSADAYLALIRV